MIRRAIACLFVMLTLAACSGGAQSPTSPSSAGLEQGLTATVEAASPSSTSPGSPAATSAPPATAVPSPTATTPAPSAAAVQPSRTPTAAGSLVPLAAMPTFTAPLGPATPTPRATVAPRPLRFVYLKEGKIRLWKEETAQANEIPAQGTPVGMYISSDGTLVAYRVRLSDQESEIRVVGVDGTGDQLLATTNAAEVPERYPGSLQYYVPTFGWVPGTHLVYYSYQRTCCDEGYDPLEVTRFVDADTGALRFTLAGGEVDTLRYAPDGRQMAALTPSELRLIGLNDGRVLYTFPVESQRGRVLSMSYSPDGRWLVAVTRPGFTVVDAQSGARRDIPFDYQPYGMGSWWLYPPIAWLADGPVFYTVFSTDSQERLFSEQTRNTVWRIDVQEGTVASVYEFTGGVWLAQLSPDRTRLLYRRIRGPGVLDLYLADLSTGVETLYDTGGGINLSSWGWAPDSLRFAYMYSQAGKVRLGSVRAAPLSLPSASQGVTFLDAERYLSVEQVGEAQRHKVISLSGQEQTIVDLTGPAPQKEPPYDNGGPLYGYYLGD